MDIDNDPKVINNQDQSTDSQTMGGQYRNSKNQSISSQDTDDINMDMQNTAKQSTMDICQGIKDQLLEGHFDDINNQFKENLYLDNKDMSFYSLNDSNNAGTLFFEPLTNNTTVNNNINCYTTMSPDGLVYNHLQLTLQAQTEIKGYQQPLPLHDESTYVPFSHSLSDVASMTDPNMCTLLDEFSYDHKHYTYYPTEESSYHPLSCLPTFTTDLFLNTFEHYSQQPFPDASVSFLQFHKDEYTQKSDHYDETFFDNASTFLVPSSNNNLTPPLLSASFSYSSLSSATDAMSDDEYYDDCSSSENQRTLCKACNHCRQAHVKCDELRPCSRCVEAGKSDCQDISYKPRGRPRKDCHLINNTYI